MCAIMCSCLDLVLQDNFVSAKPKLILSLYNCDIFCNSIFLKVCQIYVVSGKPKQSAFVLVLSSFWHMAESHVPFCTFNMKGDRYTKTKQKNQIAHNVHCRNTTIFSFHVQNSQMISLIRLLSTLKVKLNMGSTFHSDLRLLCQLTVQLCGSLSSLARHRCWFPKISFSFLSSLSTFPGKLSSEVFLTS